MAEYGSMFLVSALGSILFLGGWNGPIPLAEWVFGQHASGLSGFAFVVANLLGLTVFMSKAVLCVTVMMWIRWTFPRLRIDQVITTCWKYCTPISAVMFVGVINWQLLGLPNGSDLLPHHQLGDRQLPGAVREGAFGKNQLMPQAQSRDEKSARHKEALPAPLHAVSDRGES